MVFNGTTAHEINGMAEFSAFLAQWVLAYYEYRFTNELIFNKAWEVFGHVQVYCKVY